MDEKPKLSEQEISESCVQILRTFQGKVNATVKDIGLKGNEPHVLNVINNGLFALLCLAKLFEPQNLSDAEADNNELAALKVERMWTVYLLRKIAYQRPLTNGRSSCKIAAEALMALGESKD